MTILQTKSPTGKTVYAGEIVGKIFRKKVTRSKHFFRTAKAWGIDVETYDNHVRSNCATILLEDVQNEKTYIISFAKFEEKKWKHSFGKFEPQYFVAEKEWGCPDNVKEELKKPVQESLF